MVDEHVRWISARVKAENGADGRPVAALGTTQDVTTRRVFEDRIHDLAHFDTLTGLPNRSQLEELRDEDVLSRLGGDELIVMAPRTDRQRVAVVAQTLLDVIAEPSVVDGYHLSLSASIGIALYPDDGTVPESLSKSADAAMYRAKQDGRDRVRLFTAELQAGPPCNLLWQVS